MHKVQRHYTNQASEYPETRGQGRLEDRRNRNLHRQIRVFFRYQQMQGSVLPIRYYLGTKDNLESDQKMDWHERVVCNVFSFEILSTQNN